jgi:hypothetical protein
LGSIRVTPIPPLALSTRIPFVLVVNPSLPVHSVTDLIALAKKDPARLSYASGGPSSPHHLFTELFKNIALRPPLRVGRNFFAPPSQWCRRATDFCGRGEGRAWPEKIPRPSGGCESTSREEQN